jgi:biotin carboxylase
MSVSPAVIVDPYSSGALFAEAFAQAGVPAVAVVSGPEPPEVYAASYRPGDFADIITFTDDLDATVQRVRALAPRCVIAGCESGVELTDAIAPAVVPMAANVPELAAARRHKGAMAAATARAGLPIIRQICTADPDAVGAWIAREGLEGRDLVVKPPKSASTDGVTRVPGGRGWRTAFDDLIQRPNRLGIVNDCLLVQEYAVGTEYVVDMFSHHGTHTVCDVCRYHKIDNGPYMAVYDRMEWLSPDDPVVDPLVAYAKEVLDAVGMRFGAAHVELMLTPDGPRLIELGARAHGGGHPRFCRVATGDSQVDRTVRLFAGLGEIPAGYELLRHVLVVFLIARRAGVVRDSAPIEAIADLESHHFSVVNLRAGMGVEPTKDLFASLDLGFVVLAHADRDQIMSDYAAIRAMENAVEIEPLGLERRPDPSATR